jgi:uncharacterized membrane protein
MLAESRPPQADEASETGHLGQYTAWAMALGEIDPWSRAITASAVLPASPGPMYPSYYYPGMAHTLRSAATASSTEPSSSGSGGAGGGGGGGVGGGGGGGGGGSW